MPDTEPRPIFVRDRSNANKAAKRATERTGRQHIIRPSTGGFEIIAAADASAADWAASAPALDADRAPAFEDAPADQAPDPEDVANERDTFVPDPPALSADQAFKRDIAARKAKKPHPADLHTFAEIAKATHFVVFRARGRGSNAKPREECATLAEARAIAAGDPRALVYAVPPNGTSIHVPADYAAPDAAEVFGPPAPATTSTKDATMSAAKKSAAKKQAPKKQAAAPKARRAAAPVAEARPPRGQAAERLAEAERGKLPTPPDFTAETHKYFRPKLEALIALVKAHDIRGLQRFEIKPISSSPKALDRYRNLAVIALKAKAAKAK